MRMMSNLALLGVAMLGAVVADAHTAWLEPVAQRQGEFRVFFGGHAGKLESYDAKKLKTVEAFDVAGAALEVARSAGSDGVHLQVKGTPALITMHFDNGIHSRTAQGPSVEKPMNETPGATRATYAVKYHKTILDWSAMVTEARGQPFEVVPLDARAPRAGEPVRVKVLMAGKPVAGVRLGRGEEGGQSDPVTDAQGIASFTPQKGFNKLWAGRRTPVTGNPAYTELSYEYLLGFFAS